MRFYKFFLLTLFVFNIAFSSAFSKSRANPKIDNAEQSVSLDKESATFAVDEELVLKPGFSSITTSKRIDQRKTDNFDVVSDSVIKILAIGNSFSQDAIETYLYELAKNEGISVVIGNLYIGGASLDLHWQNASGNKPAYDYRKIDKNGVKTNIAATTIATALADESWDYISFQQVSSNSGKYETFVTPLPLLFNYVKQKTTNPNVKYILHQTWAYAQNSTHKGFANYNKDQKTMYKAIVDAVGRAKVLIGADLIVPAGTAIQNGRSSLIGDEFNRDGYHLDVNIGRYTAACAWFEAVFGKSVIGNSFKPDALSDYEAEIAQHAAHSAVLKPNEVTEMVEYKDRGILTKPVQNEEVIRTVGNNNNVLLSDLNMSIE